MLFRSMYADAQAAAGAAGAAAGASAGPEAAGAAPDDNVVDAEVKEVKKEEHQEKVVVSVASKDEDDRLDNVNKQDDDFSFDSEDVGAGPDIRMAGCGSQHGVGMPVGTGFGVIVNGDLDAIYPCKAVGQGPVFFFGLGGQELYSHVFGEGKCFFPLLTGLRDDHAEGHQGHPF